MAPLGRGSADLPAASSLTPRRDHEGLPAHLVGLARHDARRGLAGVPRPRVPRPRSRRRGDRRGRLPQLRGSPNPGQHPQQSGGQEARGVHAQRPQAERAPRRRQRSGRAHEGHGHRRRRRRGALRRRASPASRDAALRLNSVRGYNRWLSDFASPRPGPAARYGCDPHRHARARRRRGATGVDAARDRRWLHPALPATRATTATERGTRCGRHSSIPACPIGLHVGGRRPGTPVADLFDERAPVHDGAGHEQADHGRGRLRVDPRPRHAALPGV